MNLLSKSRSFLLKSSAKRESQRAQDGSNKVGSVGSAGSTVPDFSLTGADGKQHSLSDYRGRKVMLCFYRYSNCPVCAYTISKLIGRYKLLAWASKLTVITVFRTDVENLRQNMTDPNAAIRRYTHTDINTYPFLALADPGGLAASKFNVAKSEALKVISLARSVITPLAHKELYLSGVKGGDTLLPSEFLIDENGVVIDVMRARKKKESMSMDRIDRFLLEQHPCDRHTRHTVG